MIKYLKKFCIILFILFCILMNYTSIVFATEESTPNVFSPAALLMDLDSGKILYEKNINEKRYPASLTKIMTAILTLENCKLSDVTTVSYDAVMTIPYGYSIANLQIGEELTIEQLLNVLMIASANDAGIVLAEHIAGSVENFAVMMNEKAKELGCTNTNFTNPSGIHDENHYTTAHDLALISRYAMQNETFRNIVSTTSYKLPITNKYEKDDRLFTNSNALLLFNNNQRSDNYYYKYATRY